MVNKEGTLSRPARWRIASLLFVHLLIAAHIIHWRLAGTTLASIQLSDAGRFAAEGVATAAFFFFASLLVITAIFGRFFCAWGCHMLALQELCRLLLRRVGIRPQLLRSRALWLVPFGAAFYAFFQPAVERLWQGVPFPAATVALTSDQLWAHLPGAAEGIAAVLIGGLMMVYLLGSLSFCKYVCPYGALFASADNLALGRIRLSGDCDGCAKCTAACTTGVRVHEEVLRLGMVANSGCMRCLECVSACSRDVLHYRFGRPALLAGSRAGLTRYGFSRGEEGLLLLFFGTTFVAVHGIYDAIPLLLALAASTLVAYLGVVAVRLVRLPFVSIRGTALRASGRLSYAGMAFSAAVAVLVLLLAHSLLIQFHHWRAGSELDALGFPRVQATYSSDEQQRAQGAAAHLGFCADYGLVDTVDWNMKLAWLARLLAQPQLVEKHLRRAITLDPTQAAAHFNLGKELARQERRAEAAEAFREAVRLAPALREHVPTGSGRGVGAGVGVR